MPRAALPRVEASTGQSTRRLSSPEHLGFESTDGAQHLLHQPTQYTIKALNALCVWKHLYGEEPLRVGKPVTALFDRHEQFATQNAPITSVTAV